MTLYELTGRARAVTTFAMHGFSAKRGLKPIVASALVASALTGCITVNAPDKPIVIELNVNIRQEVIYRLAEDAGNTIEDNADIF